MANAVIDTTVIIHLFRRNPEAIAWYQQERNRFYVTPVVWMEVMVGVQNKQSQKLCYSLLNTFELLYLAPEDMDWAMQQMLLSRLSRGVTTMDCFNASVCHRLRIPVYTHNQKDYLKLLPSNLVVKPYP